MFVLPKISSNWHDEGKGANVEGFFITDWQALTTANANTKQCSKPTLRDFLIPFSMY